MSGGRPGPGRRLTRAAAPGLTARDVIGMAHVALGAYWLATGVFGAVFAMSGVTPWMLAAYGGLVATALATIVAGLWLRDGRPRGALLAAVLDGVRLVLLLLVVRALTLDVVITAALLGGVAWLWPTLGRDEASGGARG